MFGWLEALIVSLVAGLIIIIIIIILNRRRFISKHRVIIETTTREAKTTAFQTEASIRRRPSYQIFSRGSFTKSYFNWADHPTLITDAVENGWSRFAFTAYQPSQSVRSSLFSNRRVTGDNNNNNNKSEIVEDSWEIGGGSVDLMQKIHFKKAGVNSTTVIRMALPLPGPPMVESFPKEAYFEITVLELKEGDGKDTREGEKTKLLFEESNWRGNSNSNSNSSGEEGLFHVSSSRGSHLLEELKFGKGREVTTTMTIGMSVGGYVVNRVPGSYPGSIGFNSDGSVFLGGMKLVFESAKEDWARIGKVIGCGFDPKKKKVYFTVNSELVHVIHCKSEDFGMPLYPVLATTLDITVLVNLGQSRFCYTPSNAHRTPNPCFIGPLVNSSADALGYEDSRELFSMGRIDAEWLSHSTTVRSTVSNNGDHFGTVSGGGKTAQNEEEGEAEFFEIVLDSKG